MKYLFAIVSLFALCCSPRKTPAPPRTPDVTTVAAYADFEREVHADTSFTDEQRAALREAARTWRTATKDRVRLRVSFDVDFASTENLRAHHVDRHLIASRVFSYFPVVKAIDGRHPRMNVIAETGDVVDGSSRVYFIVDRINPKNFRQVAIHEFGHVFGLDDLPVLGAIMSWAEVDGEPLPETLTEADFELCRRARFCD